MLGVIRKMKLATKLLLLSLIIHLFGCEDENRINSEKDSKIVYEKMESIDMSNDEVAKSWFRATFNTPFEQIANLQGICIAWGGDGKCAYSFETLKGANVSPKNKMVEEPCSAIYESFTYAFGGIEEDMKVSDITCFVGMDSDNGLNIASTKKGNLHFAWEFYAVR